MTKAKKLKICDYVLIFAGIFTLASSIQLEATGSKDAPFIWLHIIIALIFSALVFYHIALHFKWSNWFGKFSKLKSPVTKILWWLFLITFVSGIIAFAMWQVHPIHSHLGGIHGKIGFVMIAIAVGHTIKRKKFLAPNKK